MYQRKNFVIVPEHSLNILQIGEKCQTGLLVIISDECQLAGSSLILTVIATDVF